jgi:hypothetical protein
MINNDKRECAFSQRKEATKRVPKKLVESKSSYAITVQIRRRWNSICFHFSGKIKEPAQEHSCSGL